MLGITYKINNLATDDSFQLPGLFHRLIEYHLIKLKFLPKNPVLLTIKSYNLDYSQKNVQSSGNKCRKRTKSKNMSYRCKPLAYRFITFIFLCSLGLALNAEKISRHNVAPMAHKTRKDLKAFVYAKRANKKAERAALAGYLPQIQISAEVVRAAPDVLIRYFPGQGSLRKTIANQDTTSRRGVSFSFSQLLISGGVPLFDYKIAKEGTKIIDAEERLSRNAVRLNVQNSFFNLQKLLLKNDYIFTLDESAKTVFERSSGKKLVGFLNQSEWLTAIADYSSAQSNVANYQHDILGSISDLERETGATFDVDQIDLSLDGIMAIDIKPIDNYLRLAAKYRPDLERQDYLIKQARLSEKRYNRSYIPTMSVVARATDQKWGTQYRLSSWYAGLDFSWSFDGMASAHSAEQNKNFQIERRLQKKDLQLQIKNEVKAAYYQLKNLVNQVKVAAVQFEQQEANLGLQRTQHKVGNLSTSGHMQAERDYEKTKFDVASLKIDMASAYQQLLFVCGYPRHG